VIAARLSEGGVDERRFTGRWSGGAAANGSTSGTSSTSCGTAGARRPGAGRPRSTSGVELDRTLVFLSEAC